MRVRGSAGQTFGAERFEKELAEMAAADRSAAQHRLFALLGPRREAYLETLADTDRSLSRQVRELLRADSRIWPGSRGRRHRRRPHAARAFGADYVANILRQQQPRREFSRRFASTIPA